MKNLLIAELVLVSILLAQTVLFPQQPLPQAAYYGPPLPCNPIGGPIQPLTKAGKPYKVGPKPLTAKQAAKLKGPVPLPPNHDGPTPLGQ